MTGKSSAGLTLMELVFILAIIGVLAAVFIPSYADYTHRLQASEAVALMSDAKTPLAEYFADRKKWPESLANLKLPTSGKYTQSVLISKGAGGSGELELTATMKSEGVDRRVTGQSVRLATKDGGRTWICSPGTMELKNLPSQCRPESK